MKLIVNGQWAFHHHVDIKSLPIPGPQEEYKINDDWGAPTPIVLNARQTVSRFLGFTQNMKLQHIAGDLECDLYYHDGNQWQKAYRVTWQAFGSRLPDYLRRNLNWASEGIIFTRDFVPNYEQSLLDR